MFLVVGVRVKHIAFLSARDILLCAAAGSPRGDWKAAAALCPAKP